MLLARALHVTMHNNKLINIVVMWVCVQRRVFFNFMNDPDWSMPLRKPHIQTTLGRSRAHIASAKWYLLNADWSKWQQTGLTLLFYLSLYEFIQVLLHFFPRFQSLLLYQKHLVPSRMCQRIFCFARACVYHLVRWNKWIVRVVLVVVVAFSQRQNERETFDTRIHFSHSNFQWKK